MKKNIITLLLVSTLFSISGLGQPVGYTFGKQIFIQSSQVSGSSAHTDFPVLLSFTDNDLKTISNGGSVESANGYDIIFTIGDCLTQLEHQIEKYNAVTGEYIAWVKVPSLSSTVDTEIHMYYGNSAVSVDPSATSVWSNGFVGVWHMSEDPSDPMPQMDESTHYDYRARCTGLMTTSDLVTAKIGNGLDFDGVNDGLTRDDNNILDIWTNDLTLSAWINPANVAAGSSKEIINKKNGGGNSGYAIRLVGDVIEVAYKGGSQSNTVGSSSSPISISASVWTYISVTFNVSTDKAKIHVNGVAEPGISINAGGSVANGTRFRIGRRQDNYMNGKMDEVRIANVKRSTNWIQTEYNNQNSPSTFYIVSAQMPASILCSIALSIELLSFNADAVSDDIVKLDWQTASEINNDFFTIERSVDGLTWSELTKVDGSGNSSSILSYSSYDYNPYRVTSYYRLKQTDFDGQYSYSKIRVVKIEAHDTVNIYPNPTTSRITIEGNEWELEQFRIHNALGQNVTSLAKILSNEGSRMIVDLSGLAPGIYYVKSKTAANRVYKQ